MHLAMGQLPHQPAVHRAKGQLAALGRVAGAGHMVQHPLQLGAGEVGVYQQASFGLDGGGVALFAQLRTGGLGAPVLPHDGVVHGLARLAVPQHRGFALVGDAHGAHGARCNARLGQRLAGCGELGAPDLQRVVLHPAGLGVDLRQLPLRLRHDVAAFVKNDAAGAGGALVECEQVGHGRKIHWVRPPRCRLLRRPAIKREKVQAAARL